MRGCEGGTETNEEEIRKKVDRAGIFSTLLRGGGQLCSTEISGTECRSAPETRV